LPSYPDPNITHKRFGEGVYAIETFGSTNVDIAEETGMSNIFRINPTMTPTFKLESSKKFYNKIKHDFKTLPFSSRFLNDLPNMNTRLNILVKNDTLYEYPPLCVSNGYTAQYEHTIFLDETKKNIFSQDEDY
jgi:methionyl aminopeptidase